MMLTSGYGSLTVAKIVLLEEYYCANLIIVRLKGSGTPCLQSCFKGYIVLNAFQKENQRPCGSYQHLYLTWFANQTLTGFSGQENKNHLLQVAAHFKWDPV